MMVICNFRKTHEEEQHALLKDIYNNYNIWLELHNPIEKKLYNYYKKNGILTKELLASVGIDIDSYN